MRTCAIAFLCVTLIGVAVLASQGRGDKGGMNPVYPVERRQEKASDAEDVGESFFVPDALILTWYS